MTDDREKQADAITDALVKAMMDEGKLIAGGWIVYEIVMRVPPEHKDMLYHAYMAGAQHLFAAITRGMDGGTDDDMRRMHMIDAELEAWAKEIDRVMITKGEA